MKLYRKIMIAVLLLSLGCMSCEKWLSVDTKDRIMEDKLFSSRDGFLIALNGVYIGLINRTLYNGALTFSTVDVMAQYYDCTLTDHTYGKTAKLEGGTVKNIFDATWESAYTLINNLNTFLEHCETEKGLLGEPYYNLYKGEALALRAFLHFDLVRIYGPVYKENQEMDNVIPYQTSSTIAPTPLLKSGELKKLIMDDLYEAEKLLLVSDPIIASGPLAAAKENESNTLKFRNMRLNYYAVKALIARAALHFDERTIALEYANQVITETQEKNSYFPFVSQGDATFPAYEDKVFSSEILFVSYNLKRSKDIYGNIFTEEKKGVATCNIGSEGLIALYDNLGAADYRYKYQWEERINLDLKPVKVFTKFQFVEKPKETTNKLSFEYYVPLIRISEMHLIKAECLAGVNDEAAYEAINTVRLARNAPFLTEGFNQKTLIQHIQWEYAREFVGEGQLFWFYKRNLPASIPNIGIGPKDGVYTMVPTDGGQFMFNKPQSELDKRK